MTLLLSVTAIIIAYYLSPLVIQRIKTKKVTIRYESIEGEKIKTTLYLTANDPLWKVIKMHKESVNEEQ